MRQTTLCVPMEVKPESSSRLAALIEQVKARAEGNLADNFAVLRDQVPVLHFMSLSVFPSGDYDPLFVLEANFDGAPGPFWGQLEAVLGDELRAILRCCKRPLTEDGALFDAVTRARATTPVAGYFEARTQQPSVFHHGNRGLTRDRILGDHALFLAVQTELDAPEAAAAANAALIHRHLRESLLGTYPWLAEPPPIRVTGAENAADWARLAAFVFGVLLLLSAPGVVCAALGDSKGDLRLLQVMAVFAAVVWAALYVNRRALSGTEVINRVGVPWWQLFWTLGLGVFTYIVLASIVLGTLLLAVHSAAWFSNTVGLNLKIEEWKIFSVFARVALIGLASAVFLVLPALVLMLRFNEMRDSSHDAPPLDEHVLDEMARREDWIAQNHMGSIVLIKPGALRSAIIRVGHLGLGLLLRATARDGFLGTMRTVHFAHWAFLNNGSRLLFLSNFDHSWGSYLDDFIEKAHVGLTLAWGCGVGFPATRMLILDGASHGRQFKTWALASRTVTRFWYSAYRALTVDQIERNHRIANGLRRAVLTEQEAETWALDL